MPDGSIAEFRYEYNLSDHLGNARVIFSDLDDDGVIQTATEVLQTDHYYPFGMRMSMDGISMGASPPNKFLYNGKELHDDLGLDWYDYGFRWYDASIARFVSVDPLAEDFVYLTTYQYASNTPIQAIDLDGLEALPVRITGYKAGPSGSGDQKASSASKAASLASEGRFLRKHPIDAISIEGTRSSAAPIARKFQNHTGFDGGRGSAKNAFRHALGQALATKFVGEEIAKEAGDAHEGNRQITREDLQGFSEQIDTDLLIDLYDSFVDSHNNEVGRGIALENPNSTNTELALNVLDAFKAGEFLLFENIGSEDDPKMLIYKSNLSDEEYTKAKASISQLDKFGRTKEEREKYLNQLKRDAENSIFKINHSRLFPSFVFLSHDPKLARLFL